MYITRLQKNPFTNTPTHFTKLKYNLKPKQNTGDVLELAVLTAAKQTDDALFERNFAQLRPYYTDCRAALPPSPQEPLVVGLNLLRLLVQNRIAEFHTELELVPPSLLDTAEVAQVAELEQRLMEGAHNKVLAARGSPASPYYVPYLDRLYSTVRDEIASCSEKAYPLLSVKEAIKLLLMSNESELQAYATQRGWEVVGGQVKFQAGAGEDGGNSGKGVLQSMDLINHCLTYAKELERIV